MIPRLFTYFLSLYFWEFASTNMVKRMQLRKFREIFEYARQNSKFYREYYGDYGVSELKIESFNDIKKVPVVNKTILRQFSLTDIMTCNIDGHINIHSTSGSTGEPFKIAFNKFEDFTAHTRVFWALRKAGYNPFNRIITVTRYNKDDTFDIEKSISLIKKLQDKSGVLKREIVSIYEPVDKIIDRLQQSKAKVLWSTPSIMQIVANRLKEKNIALDFPVVFFTSEVISPIQKELFHKYLGRYIVNLYGCMESPSLGFDFNLTGTFTVFPSSSLFEFVNISDANAGERTCKVIITNLLNRTMPIIRYDLNDIAQYSENKSFGHKYIGRIYGREDDIIRLSNGKEFAHHHAHEMFMDFHECEMFRFIQKTDDSVTLQLKISKKSNSDFVKKLALERWNKRYNDVALEIEFKESFEVDANTGKFKNIEKVKNHD